MSRQPKEAYGLSDAEKRDLIQLIRTWAYLKEQMAEFDRQGRIHYPKAEDGKPRLKRYESEYEGTARPAFPVRPISRAMTTACF